MGRSPRSMRLWSWANLLVLVAGLGLSVLLLLRPAGGPLPDSTPTESEPLGWLPLALAPDVAADSVEIRDLVVGPTGAVWVAASTGVYRIADDGILTFNRSNGLRDDQAYALAVTERGAAT